MTAVSDRDHPTSDPRHDSGHDHGSHAMGADDHRSGTAAHAAVPDRHTVVGREKEEHGGIKIGSCFFGWLTATGMALVLTALAAAAGAAVGLATDTDVAEASDTASQQADTVGIVSGIVLLLIVFVAYYCGGYVAGRMARFDGMKQGLGVWLWAIVIAIVVAVIGAVAGAEFNVLKELNSFPRIPLDEGTMTTAGIVAAVAVLVASLVGALLGGLAGMRFHRKVDKTGFGH